MSNPLDELRAERATMLEIARTVLAGKSRSYVKDAEKLSQYLLEREDAGIQMFENLIHVQGQCTELKKELRRAQGIPEEMELRCPDCGNAHVDREEWATTRKHKTHLCEHCAREWRPFPYFTVGVQPKEQADVSSAGHAGAMEEEVPRDPEAGGGALCDVGVAPDAILPEPAGEPAASAGEAE